ncbi:hypothetical protein JAAARDRAFT_195965 [Jaapia argillacea MUCL 33604]|uniref:BTB domain-containing protein n=1 Tax=Jaapia argillacea MUCL 33604 TaxID=933084 RepID=A0A067PUY5_9AGAM|nr:hypothetical protein JAAARDRAFT_195965 [Jaapia argillacea MUCL 33604]
MQSENEPSDSPPSPPDASSPQPKRNDMYFLEPITFLVEDQLFKVPRRLFVTHSCIFNTTFTLPPGNRQAEGSDEHPLRLEGISAVDFQSLLKVMYPLEIGTLELSWDEWRSALRLATMFEFDQIRQMALEKMPTYEMDPVEVILTAREFSLESWILPAYRQVVRRNEFLTLEDAQRLGWDTAVGLLQVRASLFSGIPAKEDGHKTQDILDILGVDITLSSSDTHELLRKLDVAKEHGMKDWALHCYRSLAIQEEPLSTDVLNNLGWNTTFRILEIRDLATAALSRSRGTKHSMKSKSPSHITAPLHTIIESVFGDDVVDLEQSRDVVNRILVAKENNLKGWLIHGYEELIQREKSLSVEEARRLGWETTVGIFRARELIRRQADLTLWMVSVNAYASLPWVGVRLAMDLAGLRTGEEVGLVRQILVAKANNLQEWLLKAYLGLVERSEPLTLVECQELGWESTHKIFRAREKIPRLTETQRSEHNFDPAIQTVFGIQIDC